MSEIYFTKDHEWLRVEGDEGTMGITDYAQKALGDVVFVDLPEPGTAVETGGEVATIESVKAASEVYAPVAGTISAVNEALNDAPETVNQDPEGEGWILKLNLTDRAALDGLMDGDRYKAYLDTLE